MKFRPAQRLLLASDYRRVFSAPDVKAGQSEFLLLARGNDQHRHRLGLAIAKKHVPTAVQRNLIKRLARECFRHLPEPEQYKPSIDLALHEQGEQRDELVGAIVSGYDTNDVRKSTPGDAIKGSSTGTGEGLDIIVLTRPGARNADRRALHAALDEQFQRLIRRAANT